MYKKYMNSRMYTNNNKRSVLPSNPGGEADEPSWLYRQVV